MKRYELFKFNSLFCFYCAGRPTGRPSPVCRPGRCLRRPAHRPAQTGARPGVGLRLTASRPAQAGSTAGDQPDGSGLLAGPGRRPGRARWRAASGGDGRRPATGEGEGEQRTFRSRSSPRRCWCGRRGQRRPDGDASLLDGGDPRRRRKDGVGDLGIPTSIPWPGREKATVRSSWAAWTRSRRQRSPAI